jgi:lipoprotein-anchoring transpeptidase ErfK/SrfK
MMLASGLGASVATGRPVFGYTYLSTLSNSFWRIAFLTIAGAIGTASQANAAVYYWPDSDPGFAQPAPTVPQARPKLRRHQGKTGEASAKETTKPQGPLIIAISIEKQHLKIYDTNGLFAETPVSTGMRGHSTPMGVFSVIQKQKFHRSNIYSGAPMPFMQRITWSGVAMHAGVLPGYPASHGCIRMPMAFAVKVWGWTKLGARVVITPGEISPTDFSHPLLVTQKGTPQQAHEPPAANPDAPPKPAISEAGFELRSADHRDDGMKPITARSPASTPLRDQTHTADAGTALRSTEAVVAQSDIGPPGEASNADGKSMAEKSETEPAAAKGAEIAPVEDKPVETASSENVNAAPQENIKAVTDAGTNVPDVKKDQSPSPDTDKAAAPKTDPAMTALSKRGGQIAIFISRKDSKLYVRQNFAPLFDVPITIAPSERPLGTHVFTAKVDRDDANILRWSVVSLPTTVKYAERRVEDERASRKRKVTGAVETKSWPMPDSPNEALDRLNLPADTMARITEALSTGSSIVVSDQGIAAGETGEGTDFIVSLR